MSTVSIDPTRYRAIITGVSDLSLTKEEVDLFQTHKPFGFILFARNIQSPVQVAQLIDQMKQVMESDHVPILIDQEGGRVARLKPPHWPAFPALGQLSEEFASDPAQQARAFQTHAETLGGVLKRQGITVNCAPMLDVRTPDSHDGVIGDRAISMDPQEVAELGQVYANGLKKAGILPVIKHLPGHGRAVVDSHEALPVVTALYSEMIRSDFVPFQALKDDAMAMTAHVLYTAIDPEMPATLSRPVIEGVIRGEIGFQNLLMTDDLTMGALNGSAADRVTYALDAGSDIALYCNGSFEDRAAALQAAPQLAGKAAARAAHVFAELTRVA